jgi:hypothetical protein
MSPPNCGSVQKLDTNSAFDSVTSRLDPAPVVYHASTTCYSSRRDSNAISSYSIATLRSLSDDQRDDTEIDIIQWSDLFAV